MKELDFAVLQSEQRMLVPVTLQVLRHDEALPGPEAPRRDHQGQGARAPAPGADLRQDERDLEPVLGPRYLAGAVFEDCNVAT